MNLVSWFEIPVFDLHRAIAFYNAVLGLQLTPTSDGAYGMAVFPADGGAGGALIAGPGCVPSEAGTLAYFDAGKDLDGALSRVAYAGGRVVVGRSLISEAAGSFGLFIDSEGNRMALLERPAGAAAVPTEAAANAAPLAIAAMAGAVESSTEDAASATPVAAVPEPAVPVKAPEPAKSNPGKRKRR